MKNIHIIPTDKPSRLWLDKNNNKLHLDIESYGVNNQHIYINSDEEIKEGDYYIHGNRLHKHLGKKCLDVLTNKEYSQSKLINKDTVFKKIILTTDQDLIKDAIQAIPDEFLEWYVKNPSCEEVEINSVIILKESRDETDYPEFDYYNYEIIIPKKEPKQDKIMERFIANAKQETLEQYLQRLKDRRTEDNYKYTDEDFEKYKDHISDCCKSGMSVYKCLEFMYFAKKDIDDQLFNIEHKQETLEENCTCTDECLGYLTKTCKRIETLEEYFLGKVKEVLLFKNDAQAIRFMEKYYQAKKEEDERNY
jgi:hypothetical protein